jgi:hypothetical protein
LNPAETAQQEPEAEEEEEKVVLGLEFDPLFDGFFVFFLFVDGFFVGTTSKCVFEFQKNRRRKLKIVC